MFSSPGVVDFAIGLVNSFLNLPNRQVNFLGECVVPENIHTPPTEGIGNSWGVGASQRPKNLSKCMRLDWIFQRGDGV